MPLETARRSPWSRQGTAGSAEGPGAVGQAMTGTPSGTAPRLLRVGTLNLWWRFGDWAARLEAIRAELARWRPDVIGLQEVWASDDVHLAEALAGELGMSWATRMATSAASTGGC